MTKPIQKFRAGAVQASVWNNQSKTGNEFKTISFERRYKDKEGNWQSAQSLNLRDLPNAMVVFGRVYEEFVLTEQNLAE